MPPASWAGRESASEFAQKGPLALGWRAEDGQAGRINQGGSALADVLCTRFEQGSRVLRPADQGRQKEREGMVEPRRLWIPYHLGVGVGVDLVVDGEDGRQGVWLAAKNARDWTAVATLSGIAHGPVLLGLPITHLSTQTIVATLILPSTPNGPLSLEDPVSEDRPRYTPSLTLHSSPSIFFHHCIPHTSLSTVLLVCFSYFAVSQPILGDCTKDSPASFVPPTLVGSAFVDHTDCPPADYIRSTERN